MSSLSQFIIYTSSDPQGAGYLTGLSGSLIQVLDACLINGYGTGSYYKAPAGWTKPLTNVTSSAIQGLSVLACYQQGSGSGFTLFVNDSGPQVTALGQEAWITGWELMTSLTGSGLGTSAIGGYTGSNSQGFGYGQFPLSSQLLTYGHVVWRKSGTITSVSRPWVIVADASTMYIWIQTGDGGLYQHYSFGDIYSLKGSSDLWKCCVYGKSTENSVGTTANIDWCDLIAAGGYGTNNPTLNTGQPAHYIARSSGGTGGSTLFTKKGDAQSVDPVSNSAPYSQPISGVIQVPNGVDNSLYMSPIWVVEPSAVLLRGRFRGMYQLCHPIANFNDGQILQGAGDYAGKSFMIIKGSNNNSMWAMETSPTVETN